MSESKRYLFDAFTNEERRVCYQILVNLIEDKRVSVSTYLLLLIFNTIDEVLSYILTESDCSLKDIKLELSPEKGNPISLLDMGTLTSERTIKSPGVDHEAIVNYILNIRADKSGLVINFNTQNDLYVLKMDTPSVYPPGHKDHTAEYYLPSNVTRVKNYNKYK